MPERLTVEQFSARTHEFRVMGCRASIGYGYTEAELFAMCAARGETPVAIAYGRTGFVMAYMPRTHA